MAGLGASNVAVEFESLWRYSSKHVFVFRHDISRSTCCLLLANDRGGQSSGAKQILEVNEALLLSRDLLQTAETSQPCLSNMAREI